MSQICPHRELSEGSLRKQEQLLLPGPCLVTFPGKLLLGHILGESHGEKMAVLL